MTTKTNKKMNVELTQETIEIAKKLATKDCLNDSNKAMKTSEMQAVINTVADKLNLKLKKRYKNKNETCAYMQACMMIDVSELDRKLTKKEDKKETKMKAKKTNKNNAKKSEKQSVYFFPSEETQAFKIDTELVKGERSAVKIAKATGLNVKRVHKRLNAIKKRKGCPYFVEKK